MSATVSRYSSSSPTAQLLRNSRLFAIPKPLPKPELREDRAEIFQHWSSTSTTPYPTLQAIQTPNRFRKIGEWGLKRRLPLKTSKNARGIYVKEQDTHDEIVDFMPATHHTKALARFQEMDLVITRHAQLNTRRGLVRPFAKPSAFDEDFDNTAQNPGEVSNPLIKSQSYALPPRWRVRGPNMRDMTQSQFDKYVETEIQSKAKDFMESLNYTALKEFIEKMDDAAVATDEPLIDNSAARWLFYTWLKSLSKEDLIKTTGALMTLSSKSPPMHIEESFTEFLNSWLSEPSNPQIIGEETSDHIISSWEVIASGFPSKWNEYRQYYIYNLRKTSGTHRPVRNAIERFLDLPISVILDIDEYRIARALTHIRPDRSLTTHLSMDTAQVLLSTHPSAGLAYRRTSRVLANHPFYGPQAQAAPIPARVLFPKPAQGNGGSNTCFGVGGIAATSKQTNWSPYQDALTDNNGTHGQAKTWVSVKHDGVEVSPSGKLSLWIEPASHAAQFVAENELGARLSLEWEAEEDLREKMANVNLADVKKIEKAKPIEIGNTDGYIGSLVD